MIYFQELTASLLQRREVGEGGGSIEGGGEGGKRMEEICLLGRWKGEGKKEVSRK